MPRHVWTILTSRAETDERNQLILGTVIEEVQANVPVFEPPMALPANWSLVTFWRRSDPAIPERFSMRMRVLWPNGESTPYANAELSLDPWMRGRTIAVLPSFTIVGPGTYYFVIEHQSGEGQAWVEDDRLPLEVSVLTIPPA